MFSPGTRVSVQSSNVVGKKLGPKAHSLGYTASIQKSNYISLVKDFKFPRQSFLISRAAVLFTRYGREKRNRLEYRHFLSVMPIFMEAKGIDIRQRIKEIMDLMAAGEFSNNANWSDFCQKYSCNSIGVLIPVQHHKPSHMEHDEIKAWISAILRSTEFNLTLQQNKNLPTFKALYTIEPKLFTWVIKAGQSKDSRESLFYWAFQRSDRLEKLIKFVRVVTSCFNKRYTENSISEMDKFFVSHPNSFSQEAFSSWFVEQMFDGDRTMSRKHQLTHTHKVDPSLRNMADCTRVVRNAYLSIKPKYI